mmetsp:Transcript_26456/g.76344  ORF Transcript_26456/g.76344 Transcript_26456/m.76344 type:complete len:211 (+) Transcript_26456:4826-5458(+)
MSRAESNLIRSAALDLTWTFSNGTWKILLEESWRILGDTARQFSHFLIPLHAAVKSLTIWRRTDRSCEVSLVPPGGRGVASFCVRISSMVAAAAASASSRRAAVLAVLLPCPCPPRDREATVALPASPWSTPALWATWLSVSCSSRASMALPQLTRWSWARKVLHMRRERRNSWQLRHLSRRKETRRGNRRGWYTGTHSSMWPKWPGQCR